MGGGNTRGLHSDAEVAANVFLYLKLGIQNFNLKRPKLVND